MRSHSWETRIGSTVNASPAAIAFLWQNWEIADQLNGNAVKIRRISPDAWVGRRWGTQFQWHMLRSDVGVERGRIAYAAFGVFLGSRFRATIECSYSRLDSMTLSYVGEGAFELLSPFAPLGRFISLVGPQATSYGNNVGAKLAETISLDPSIVREKAGESPWSIYNEFLIDEELGRNGQIGRFGRLSADLKSSSAASELNLLQRKLEALEEQVAGLRSELFPAGYREALQIFAVDPEQALGAYPNNPACW